ncbi:MAG TPA: alpha/beta fold hydrolase [Pyrinomonadaceae bacterium]
MRRKLILGGGGVVAAALVAVWLAGSVLTAPARSVVGDPPAEIGGRGVAFQSESGATLRGWLLPGERGAGAIILMHGIRGSRAQMLSRARFLRAAGYGVLLFDFQAHGESAGEQITAGYLESRDARAAVGFARASFPGERIGVLGVSMGGAAVLLASPPADAEALVLEMVYPTVEQAIDNRLTMRLGGWAGVLSPLLTAQLKLRLGVGADDLRPVERVGRIAAPKLFIAGAEDRHTTLAESKSLFDAAAAPKEFWAVAGARHEDLHALRPREYEQRVLAFFARHLKR